ncbi:Cytoplasmic and mitochondrial histidine tRNA synthetase [Aspergillus melleus]|uniref:Cytoplasmic and mitochondrial histidine tRNA synthetase n=1 Tax=Aspergillus melleus TaxID=138277 RepID=A0ACC3BFD5_9EURO|nr:Cytoplasmic and mitochondrial histidine tRNA synthetase [Aspergillus melleus]
MQIFWASRIPVKALSQSTNCAFRRAAWTSRDRWTINTASHPYRQFQSQFSYSTQHHPHEDPNPDITMGAKEGKAGKVSFQLKTAKGTRDWQGIDMNLRDSIFSNVADVFKRHGGTALDTPVFELKEILAGKYGEDSKLIYDLADQGGEICALRYDLTVPFARWLAMNSTIQNIKRYHIAKVYRRDQPAVAKGRMREFYQCDFDIAGTYDAMIPDAEIVRIIVDVFEALGLREDITIKINHRKILDGLFTVAGVPEDKIRSISSAVDKLDKSPWEEVKKEMEEKGLSPEVADKIGEYVKLSGGRELVDTLKADAQVCANEDVKKGLDDMELLFKYLEVFNVTDKLSFDLSLARGLDYYTGLIFEVVTPLSSADGFNANKTKSSSKPKKSKDNDEDRSNDNTIGVGSVAAGGRYDNLVNMFAPKRQIPCVGVSFGIDRIFTIMKQRLEKEQQEGNATIRPNEVEVFVMAFGGKGFNGLLLERMSVADQLWKAGIKAEYTASVKPRLPAQFKQAENGGVPLAVILGEDEVAAGKVKLKVLGLPDGHPEKDGRLISRDDLVSEVKKALQQSS